MKSTGVELFSVQEAMMLGEKEIDSGTLRYFLPAANLHIHLRGLVLDGVYCSSGKVPVFHQAPAPTNDHL